MQTQHAGAPQLRAPQLTDFTASLALGWQDFRAHPFIGLFFAGIYASVGLLMTWVTYVTATSFWLILAVLGFPLIGAFAALGLYEVSRLRMLGQPIIFRQVVSVIGSGRSAQVPWLAVIIVVIFLFWFFLGHMIFALFLGFTPMTNISSSLTVYFTSNGMIMLAFGTAIGAAFSSLIYAMSVLGMPMILDREVDFVTAMITSIGQVAASPLLYLSWGAFIGAVTLLAMIPAFMGLLIVLPILGHATWHLYSRLSTP